MDTEITVLKPRNLQLPINDQLAAFFIQHKFIIAAIVIRVFRVFFWVAFTAGDGFTINLDAAFAVRIANLAVAVCFIGVKTITAIINIPTAVTAQGIVIIPAKQLIITSITV